METRNYVGGEWVGAGSDGVIAVSNPATDEPVAEVPSLGREGTRAAIEAAARALGPWRDMPAQERASLLGELADRMMADQDRLSRLMTLEGGKPLTEARGEIAYAASFVEWAAEEAKRIYGEIVPASKAGKRILVLRQPIGVCCAITPWNFPSAMVTRKLGPALASGCTMVVKPASETPLSAIAIAELCDQIGFPPGVVSVVTGDARSVAAEFLENQHVRKLSFTGSTEVGKVLMRQASERLVRLSLELGGHAPFVAFDDCDMEAAVEGAIASKFRNAGQTCVCPNRYYIQRGIYGEFLDRLEARLRSMRIGPGDEEGVEIGPLIDDAAVEKVERHVLDAVDKGATLRCGGERVRPRGGLSDRFFPPTLLDGFTPEMLLSCEETFGPVIPARPFDSEEEAVAMANDSRYGLAAYFYTRDASRLVRVAEALEYGIIGANDAMPSTAQAPFGGVKESGFGREGGKYAMGEYTSVKYVSLGV